MFNLASVSDEDNPDGLSYMIPKVVLSEIDRFLVRSVFCSSRFMLCVFTVRLSVNLLLSGNCFAHLQLIAYLEDMRSARLSCFFFFSESQPGGVLSLGGTAVRGTCTPSLFLTSLNLFVFKTVLLRL